MGLPDLVEQGLGHNGFGHSFVPRSGCVVAYEYLGRTACRRQAQPPQVRARQASPLLQKITPGDGRGRRSRAKLKPAGRSSTAAGAPACRLRHKWR
jgi:hypothetical protein